jgi:hypothetical protein
LTTIGGSAFAQCFSLLSVTLPSSLATIGMAAFQDCQNLTSIKLPDTITNIQNSTFDGCVGLTNVTLSSGLTSINGYAFNFCRMLTSMTIPDGVTYIGPAAFAYCYNLTRVTLPSSLRELGPGAFQECDSLQAVYFQGNRPIAYDTTFYNANNATMYYLPGTTNWGPTLVGRPTNLWLPELQPANGSFGPPVSPFGFNIVWASGKAVVVEASTSLVSPLWSPLATNTITGGTSAFSDVGWTNHSAHFYRVRTP